MKKLIACILLLTTCSLSTKAITNTWCVINLKDGSQQSYLIKGRVYLIPSDSILKLTSPTIEAEYVMSNILSFKFNETDEIDAIEHAAIPDIKVVFTSPDEVKIYGLAPNQPIHLFSTNGTGYPVNTKYDEDAITISLRSLSAGVYLITIPNINTPAIKIIKK